MSSASMCDTTTAGGPTERSTSNGPTPALAHAFEGSREPRDLQVSQPRPTRRPHPRVRQPPQRDDRVSALHGLISQPRVAVQRSSSRTSSAKRSTSPSKRLYASRASSAELAGPKTGQVESGFQVVGLNLGGPEE